MCGLFGAVGTSLNNHDLACVKELGFLSALRGMDSTGVGLVFRKHGKKFRNTTSYTMAKSAENSIDFLYNGDFDKIISSFKDTLCVMGHTRLATVGKIAKDNAHPFFKGHIIGAHNGGIPKWYMEQKRQDKTDSEKLIQEIADRGLVDALKLAGEAAAWGLSYLDTQKNSLTLTRNKERPLAMLTTRDRKKIFWASDPMFLELVKARFSDKIDFDKDVEKFIEHEILTWHFGNAKFEKDHLHIPYREASPPLPRLWTPVKKEESDEVEDAYYENRKLGEYPASDTSPFKTQEDIELARAKEKALPMLPTPLVEIPSKKIEPINKFVEALKVTESSVETAARVFDGGIPCFGYPEVLILNEHRKVLQFMDWSGKFIGRLTFARDTGQGCMLCGKYPTMDDKIWWLDERTFVFHQFINDPLILDHMKSNDITPRLGQGVYISPRLMFGARHRKQEDAVKAMELASKQLHDYGRWLWSPISQDWEFDEERVECH